MKRFYVTKNVIRYPPTSINWYVRDRSYNTTANVMCDASTRRDAYIITKALNAMEKQIPSHDKNKTFDLTEGKMRGNIKFPNQSNRPIKPPNGPKERR
jgi:hypothetical protein